MKNIKKILGEIGLNHFESKIYEELLHNGEKAASAIGRSTNIPRSTTRGILDRLCERGIIRKVYKSNTQYYACKEPKSLIECLNLEIDQKKKSINELQIFMPLLESLYQKRNIAPKVQVFEGRKQIIEAFNMSLYEEGLKEILIFTSYAFLQDPLIRKNDDDFFIKQRIKRGIKARVLVGKTIEAAKLKRYSKRELRERRFIPEKYSLPGNIHIYGDCVLYFATKGEYLAVLIQGAMVADTLKTLFEFMWEQCK